MDIKLWNGPVPYQTDAETPNLMHTYFLETSTALPCIVVLPGGGYHRRAQHEGQPIAEFFNSRGMHAAVVDYRVAPNRFPSGLTDAQRAVRLLRAHAAEWKIDTNRIIICGFSAGGHLAASMLMWEDALPPDFPRDEADRYSCRPNGGILSYPVISTEAEFGHVGSGKNLLGEERYRTDAAHFSLQNLVTDDMPKVFLWHTSDDSVVPVQNSLIFCQRLREHGIPFELHVYPHGAHGLGLATARADVSGWANLAADWIQRNFSDGTEPC